MSSKLPPPNINSPSFVVGVVESVRRGTDTQHHRNHYGCPQTADRTVTITRGGEGGEREYKTTHGKSNSGYTTTSSHTTATTTATPREHVDASCINCDLLSLSPDHRSSSSNKNPLPRAIKVVVGMSKRGETSKAESAREREEREREREREERERERDRERDVQRK